MTTTTDEKKRFGENNNLLKLKLFIEVFGTTEQSNDYYEWTNYFVLDIPRSASLSVLGMKAKSLNITIDEDSITMFEGVPISRKYYPLSFLEPDEYEKEGEYDMKDNPEAIEDRARRWLENDDFLLWAVRDSVEDYCSYSEKLIWILEKLEIRNKEDLNSIPESFNDIKKLLPKIKNEDIAQKIFFNDDFLIWAIRAFINSEIIELPF